MVAAPQQKSYLDRECASRIESLWTKVSAVRNTGKSSGSSVLPTHGPDPKIGLLALDVEAFGRTGRVALIVDLAAELNSAGFTFRGNFQL